MICPFGWWVFKKAIGLVANALNKRLMYSWSFSLLLMQTELLRGDNKDFPIQSNANMLNVNSFTQQHIHPSGTALRPNTTFLPHQW